MCILIVEDEALIRDLLVEALASHGHEVCEAATGDQAVALIENPSKAFTLLITDLHMPGQRDGVEVARLMRQHHPSLPISTRPDGLRRWLRSGLWVRGMLWS
jgi:CheY-like chemotaxis protein